MIGVSWTANVANEQILTTTNCKRKTTRQARFIEHTKINKRFKRAVTTGKLDASEQKVFTVCQQGMNTP